MTWTWTSDRCASAASSSCRRSRRSSDRRRGRGARRPELRAVRCGHRPAIGPDGAGLDDARRHLLALAAGDRATWAWALDRLDDRVVVTDDAAGELRRLLAWERCASHGGPESPSRPAYRDAVIDPVAAEPAADRADPPAAAPTSCGRRSAVSSRRRGCATPLLAGQRPPTRTPAPRARPAAAVGHHRRGHRRRPSRRRGVGGMTAPTNVERADRLATGAELKNLTVLEARFRRRRELPTPSISCCSTTSSPRPTTLVGPRSRRSSPARPCRWTHRRRLPDEGRLVRGRPAAPFGAAVRTSGAASADWQRRAIVEVLERLSGCRRPLPPRPTDDLGARRSGRARSSDDLADVLLAEHLEPMALADVADWLAPTGATFIGSAGLGTSTSTQTRRWSNCSTTRRTSRCERRFGISRSSAFRIDLFRRGTAASARRRAPALLMELELVGLGRRCSEQPATMTCGDCRRTPRRWTGDRGRPDRRGRRTRRRRSARHALLRRAWPPTCRRLGSRSAATSCCSLNRYLADPEPTPAASARLTRDRLGGPWSSADPGDLATGALHDPARHRRPRVNGGQR